MNGTNGNQNDYPENCPCSLSRYFGGEQRRPGRYENWSCSNFSGYIASLSMRKLYDERGNVYYGVDEDIRERLQARLMRAILTFRAE